MYFTYAMPSFFCFHLSPLSCIFTVFVSLDCRLFSSTSCTPLLWMKATIHCQQRPCLPVHWLQFFLFPTSMPALFLKSDTHNLLIAVIIFSASSFWNIQLQLYSSSLVIGSTDCTYGRSCLSNISINVFLTDWGFYQWLAAVLACV